MSKHPTNYAPPGPTVVSGPSVAPSSIPAQVFSSPTMIPSKMTGTTNNQSGLQSLHLDAMSPDQLLMQLDHLSPSSLSQINMISSVVEGIRSNTSSSCCEVADDISVIPFIIDYKYLLLVATETDIKGILSDIEKSLHEHIVKTDLDCQAVASGMKRRTQIVNNSTNEPPVGFDTSPVDSIKEGDFCDTERSTSVRCEVIKGGFTIFLQKAAQKDTEKLRRRYIDISKDFMETQLPKDTNYSIIGLHFLREDVKNQPLSGSLFDGRGKQKNGIATGLVIVIFLIVSTCSAVIFVYLVSFIVRKRRMRECKKRDQADHDFDLGNNSDIFSSEDGLSSVGISFTVHAEKTSSSLNREIQKQSIPPCPSLLYGIDFYLNNKAWLYTSDLTDIIIRSSDISPTDNIWDDEIYLPPFT